MWLVVFFFGPKHDSASASGQITDFGPSMSDFDCDEVERPRKRRKKRSRESHAAVPRTPRLNINGHGMVTLVGDHYSGLGTLMLGTECLPKTLGGFRYVFGCDSSPSSRRLLEYALQPGMIFDDVSNAKNAPHVDLFGFSPPCQPFSPAGQHLGTRDERYKCIFATLVYIEQEKPNMLFFEESDLLLGKYFLEVLAPILHALDAMGYYYDFGRVKTDDHGVGQTRKRTIVACVHTAVLDVELMQTGFCLLPPPLPFECVRAGTLIKKNVGDGVRSFPGTVVTNIQNARAAARAQGIDTEKTAVFVDALGTEGWSTWNVEACPTITAKRGGAGGHFLLHRDRFTDLDELSALMGIPAGRLAWQEAGIAKTNYGHMLGNAVSVNVIERLIPRLLRACGRITNRQLQEADVWLHNGHDAKWVRKKLLGTRHV
jgi:site-specific DNA-cytosine methylase